MSQQYLNIIGFYFFFQNNKDWEHRSQPMISFFHSKGYN